MNVVHSNAAILPEAGKWKVVLPRPVNHPSTHPVVERAERTIQACVNLGGVERNAQGSVPGPLRTRFLADVAYTPISGLSRLLERVDEKRWQVHCIVASVASAERTVDSALEQTAECVGAASLRMKDVAADLARTLCSVDGLPHGERQVLACLHKAVGDVLHETTCTVERMHKIKSQVDNVWPVDSPAVAESPADASPTTRLSAGVDRLVGKSSILRNLVSDFAGQGGTIGYHETDGRSSEVTVNSRGDRVLLLQKDSSRSPEATVREIAWQLGRIDTLPADLAQKSKPEVAPTALAALVGSKVRAELLSAGESDIGLAHPNAQRYLAVYEEYSSDARTAYVFLYHAALADYGKVRIESMDSWQARIVPN